jgi:hypothetical protein
MLVMPPHIAEFGSIVVGSMPRSGTPPLLLSKGPVPGTFPTPDPVEPEPVAAAPAPVDPLPFATPPAPSPELEPPDELEALHAATAQLREQSAIRRCTSIEILRPGSLSLRQGRTTMSL